jgi:hypothetical protein
LSFLNTTTASAYGSYSGNFGGKIINTKAWEIQGYESVGYVCIVPGQTFTIKPMGSPVGTPMSYFVSLLAQSRTTNSLRTGQWILGRYAGKTSITCTLPYPPYTAQVVSLSRVSVYGTSR